MPLERLLCLSPSYFSYRVPVFEEMHRHLGRGLTIVSLRPSRLSQNARVALKMGSFPQRLVRGRHFSISNRHDDGLQTPFGITWAPMLPFLLASVKPDVIISNNFGSWTLAAIVLGYRTVVFWEGTFHTERTVPKWRKMIRVWMARHARSFVVDGALSRSYLTNQLRIKDEKIFVGGLCPERPPAEFTNHPREVLNYGQTIRFLFVGRLINRKGWIHLLEATGLLQKEVGSNGNFHVMFIGDGPAKSSIDEKVSELGINDKVTFHGYSAPKDVWKHFAQAHVFVLPTLQDNWPLVVPEAMSMGLPILLSKHAGSVPDLINIGQNGYVFDPLNHKELANLMRKYIDDPTLVMRHGHKSLELVRAYTPQRVANVMLAAADHALNH